LKQIRKRLTYANVMSSLAVFLILGGATAFAAVKKVGPNEIKANSIKTGKIVKEAVTKGKIKNGAVSEAKLADGAVTTNKLADNAVTTPKIAKDAVNAEKIAANAVTNAKVANGALSANKLGAITVQTEITNVANNTNGEINVGCPAGQRAISGGGAWGAFAAALDLLSTRPIRSAADGGVMADGEVPGGWRAAGRNTSGGATTLAVWVVCAS
jgi:hypothetical protein